MKNSKKYNKLVRDKIPKIIKDSGKECKYHRANIPEYNLKLYDKMCEELVEFMEYPTIEEAADMFEVYKTMLRNWHIDFSDVLVRAAEKESERGGFRDGIILEEVYEQDD